LSPYLKQLEALPQVKRQIPVTTPLEQREHTKTSQYLVSDPSEVLLPFIAPNAELVEQELTKVLWERISNQFRAFIGMTSFEVLYPEAESVTRDPLTLVFSHRSSIKI
jgi:hypothetical protein